MDFEISLEPLQLITDDAYCDTPIRPNRPARTSAPARRTFKGQRIDRRERPIDDAIAYRQYDDVNRQNLNEVPERIQHMLSVYEYGDGSLDQKRKNFIVQGRLMEDYEDDTPWNGTFKRYFATYHDLNIPQLRGYFTWRTRYRHGHVENTSASFAYIYVYELLNGIGAEDAEDSLNKLDEFVESYIDSGIGPKGMRHYLDRWRYEFAVMNRFPVERSISYLDAETVETDRALHVLSHPEEHPPSEVHDALMYFDKGRRTPSAVVKKLGEEGEQLFAEAWRAAMHPTDADGNAESRSIFEEVFGKRLPFVWRPFSNAMVYMGASHDDARYELDPCRSYELKNGIWSERRYDPLYFDMDKLHAFIRGTDRFLRSKLKTGSYLKEQPGESWVDPFVDAAIASVERAKVEAARPRIEIDASSLGRIREDAAVVRDSLIVDEDELAGIPEIGVDGSSVQREEDPDADLQPEGTPETAAYPETNSIATPQLEGIDGVTVMPEGSLLAGIELQVMKAVLNGASPNDLFKENHLMPSIIVDSINEMLFDEIGDNVLECDGDDILLVEDYADEVSALIDA